MRRSYDAIRVHGIVIEPDVSVVDRGADRSDGGADGGALTCGDTRGSATTVPSWTNRVVHCLRRRTVPIAVAGVMLVAGMAFELFWLPVVYHQARWFTPVDVWGMFRAAHFVGWGYLGGIYTQGNDVVTFPGMPVLLAPVAMLSGALHLTESYNTLVVVKPTALLVLMPVELVLASTAVFAADALGQEIGVSAHRRAWLCVLVGGLALPAACVWGHAEDPLAMTFVLYAMVSVLRGNWTRAGWLFGCAVVVQPLSALVVPLFLVASPRGQRVLFAVRSSVLSVFLVGVAFLGNPSETFRALAKQPTPPSLNHATPWVALAPKVPAPPALAHVNAPAASRLIGSVIPVGHPVVQVSGGPGRLIDIVLALLVAAYVWRRPQPAVRLLWLAGAVLASRCLFEAVMTPYYLTPPLILLLVLSGRTDARQFFACGAVAVLVSVHAYSHLSAWGWWFPVVVAMSVIVVLTAPSDSDGGGWSGERSPPAAVAVDPSRAARTDPPVGAHPT
jgi:hypothetical protein